jgi:predicted metal-dependent hydrolase
MNHGARFWRVCAGLIDAGEPAPQQIVERARAWLRQNGPALHAVRFRA